jgi:hypothetical protein
MISLDELHALCADDGAANSEQTALVACPDATDSWANADAGRVQMVGQIVEPGMSKALHRKRGLTARPQIIRLFAREVILVNEQQNCGVSERKSTFVVQSECFDTDKSLF